MVHGVVHGRVQGVVHGLGVSLFNSPPCLNICNHTELVITKLVKMVLFPTLIVVRNILHNKIDMSWNHIEGLL